MSLVLKQSPAPAVRTRRRPLSIVWSVITRVVLWWVAQAALELVKAPANLQPYIAHLAHVFQFAWMAGIASVFAEEVFHASIATCINDIASESFVPVLQESMAKLTQAVSDSIAKKDLTIRAIGIETSQPAVVARQMGDDPRLAQVKELIEKNRFRDAIARARPLAQ
jgi:hypothetical protein